MSRLKEKYRKELTPALMKLCGYKNIMQVPRLDKVVLNIGLGEATQDNKALLFQDNTRSSPEPRNLLLPSS